MKELIQNACDVVGGQTALARLLTQITGKKVTQQRVSTWLVRGTEVPTEFMAAIEVATAGKVTRKEFRPDDWQSIWPELAADSPCTSPIKYGRRKGDRKAPDKG